MKKIKWVIIWNYYNWGYINSFLKIGRLDMESGEKWKVREILIIMNFVYYFGSWKCILKMLKGDWEILFKRMVWLKFYFRNKVISIMEEREDGGE